ncbi:betaine-aldehyde dehydrogenase [Pseudoclavibacter endophyticus]|uniref:Aldehyde dehydrogenase family protein n=1 Tax=Pseudoclavibacter endophyticus TaxID=1778590 RepID=A0A6H9WKN8_9MICO|nr:aldehyde dehydrogenase family protein [Pseudoclavibacter endophyticus]KAB1648062.1 aldehyde dehydrogenase family protein [Pseudoclavibacter endophyticus]GGA69384.1 betaine-aldehyde dehydrogenase [Pseudoclavibacter endophyticus]
MTETTFIPHVIGSDEREASDGRSFDNIDPWTQRAVASVARGGPVDAAAAMAAARAAFDDGPWPLMSERERGVLLHRFADVMASHAEDLALADAHDMGRPIAAMRTFDVPRAIGMIRFFADHLALATADTYPMGPAFHAFTAYRPAGVVVAISPWNHPLMLGVWKIAAALTWGNTVVWKPAEDSPTSASLVGAYALEAGIPAGALNVVQGRGSEIGDALTSSAGADRITFTGSTATGRRVAEIAAKQLVPVTLELGGKGATIVLDDADLELAASTAARAVFNNTGQVCLAGTRVLVHNRVREAFMARFQAHAEALRVGDPFDAATDLGPLASQRQFERVSGYFDLAHDEGTVLLGGPGEGWTFTPTIVTDLDRRGRVWREEVFGPMAAVTGFDDLDEAVAAANDTDYGLTAVVFTESTRLAHTIARRLRSGTVWVNCYQVRDLRAPIGGPGSSGIGREGGDFSREFFTEPQAVFLSTSVDDA